jgi:hypothetical protein
MSNGIGTSDDFAHLSPEKYIIIFNQFNLLLSQPRPKQLAAEPQLAQQPLIRLYSLRLKQQISAA